MTDDYYQLGKIAYKAWATSPLLAQFDKHAPAKDVMRLFLPPVPQDMMQVARPMPKEYREWLRGFEDEKREVTT